MSRDTEELIDKVSAFVIEQVRLAKLDTKNLCADILLEQSTFEVNRASEYSLEGDNNAAAECIAAGSALADMAEFILTGKHPDA